MTNMFDPDWSQEMSKEQFEIDMNETFRGEGWYTKEGDHMLVLQYGPNYKIYVWNKREVWGVFKRIVELPRHV